MSTLKLTKQQTLSILEASFGVADSNGSVYFYKRIATENHEDNISGLSVAVVADNEGNDVLDLDLEDVQLTNYGTLRLLCNNEMEEFTILNGTTYWKLLELGNVIS